MKTVLLSVLLFVSGWSVSTTYALANPASPYDHAYSEENNFYNQNNLNNPYHPDANPYRKYVPPKKPAELSKNNAWAPTILNGGGVPYSGQLEDPYNKQNPMNPYHGSQSYYKN